MKSVYEGRGLVPLGFYRDQTADPTAVEPCRACQRTGSVWTLMSWRRKRKGGR